MNIKIDKSPAYSSDPQIDQALRKDEATVYYAINGNAPQKRVFSMTVANKENFPNVANLKAHYIAQTVANLKECGELQATDKLKFMADNFIAKGESLNPKGQAR